MTPQETDPNLPMGGQESLAEVWVGSGLLQGYGSAVACCRGRGSGCGKPGNDISPHRGDCHELSIEWPEFTKDWGNRLLEGTRTQEKEAVTPQETDPNLPRSVQESPAEV